MTIVKPLNNMMLMKISEMTLKSPINFNFKNYAIVQLLSLIQIRFLFLVKTDFLI